MELTHLGDELVEGVVCPEGTGQRNPFSGWLELLALLEAPQARTPSEP